jgi:hypothetical protein
LNRLEELTCAARKERDPIRRGIQLIVQVLGDAFEIRVE